MAAGRHPALATWWLRPLGEAAAWLTAGRTGAGPCAESLRGVRRSPLPRSGRGSAEPPGRAALGARSKGRPAGPHAARAGALWKMRAAARAWGRGATGRDSRGSTPRSGWAPRSAMALHRRFLPSRRQGPLPISVCAEPVSPAPKGREPRPK